MYTALLRTGRLSNEQKEETQRLGLEASLALSQVRDRVRILVELAPHLTGVRLERALEVTSDLSEERAGVLAKLAPRLKGEERVQVLDQALTAVLTLSKERDRAKVLAELAPRAHRAAT